MRPKTNGHSYQMSSALCTQHREKRYKELYSPRTVLHQLLWGHIQCATPPLLKAPQSQQPLYSSTYLLSTIYQEASNLSHTNGPKKKPLLLYTLHHCTRAKSYRKNRSNLLIRDARLLCPCYTHSLANTAAFIEATELLPSKLSLTGTRLCATTAVAGLFRKSLRSCEKREEGWVIVQEEKSCRENMCGIRACTVLSQISYACFRRKGVLM